MQPTDTDNNTVPAANVEVTSLYLRPDEAAKLLGISRRTLSNWQKWRVIPFHKVCRTVVIKRTDIETALARFRINAVGDPSTQRKRCVTHTKPPPP